MHARAPAWAGPKPSRRPNGPWPILKPTYRIRDVISSFRFSHRSQASLASSTAINAHPAVPAPLRALYKSLEIVKKDAAEFVNLSRLNLSLRSLESTSPVIRIALLDLQSQKVARKLARLVLIDPFTPESPWEKQLEYPAVDDRRSLLIRYGEDTEPLPPRGLLNTVHIPSRLLKERNIEILLSSVNAGMQSPPKALEYSVLKHSATVPTVETARSSDGAVSFIRYPVHRAIVLAENVEGSLLLGRYATPQTVASGFAKHQFIAGVNYNTPLHNMMNLSPNENLPLLLLNLNGAQTAVDAYRTTGTKTTSFEEGWLASGMPAVNQWLKGLESDSKLQSPVFDLILDILEEATASIQESELSIPDHASNFHAQNYASKSLDKALTHWNTQAHNELQEGLEQAFNGTSWARLQWWKLFWRIDDVGGFLAEILEQGWLPKAEKSLIYLAGRFREAGLLQQESVPISVVHPTVASPEASQPTKSIHEAKTVSSTTWPSIIPSTRVYLLKSSIPPLEVTAQKLLLQTTTGFASSVAASVVVLSVFPFITTFEALAFAVFGIVWSVRRLQIRWEDTRSKWQGQVQEAGRAALKATDAGMRAALTRGSETARGRQDTEMWSKSRDAVNKAVLVLEGLSSKQGEARGA